MAIVKLWWLHLELRLGVEVISHWSFFKWDLLSNPCFFSEEVEEGKRSRLLRLRLRDISQLHYMNDFPAIHLSQPTTSQKQSCNKRLYYIGQLILSIFNKEHNVDGKLLMSMCNISLSHNLFSQFVSWKDMFHPSIPFQQKLAPLWKVVC